MHDAETLFQTAEAKQRVASFYLLCTTACTCVTYCIQMDDADACLVCAEVLDITDRAVEFCDCGYSMCLWCYHRLQEQANKENLPAKCPNCRSEYDQDKIKMQQIDPQK